MLHAKFQGHWSMCSGEEDYKRFLPYRALALWPSWSCDLDSLNVFLFPPPLGPLEALYEIWLQLAKGF